ncbi:MAG: hypothetical protein K0S28_1457 [Paucimonas sp.]|jgi:hypothetical protein|nr:hypothetical protein [Paucimonas sp.]
MKKRLAFPSFLPLLLVMFVTACAGLSGPRRVELPLHQLQQAMSNRFPFNSRYLELLDINVSNPRLSLQPGTNRVLTSLDAFIAPPFTKSSWAGTVTISGGLRFDPMRNAIMLSDPRMENFNVNGLDPMYSRQAGKIGSFLAAELLKDLPLYTFRPDELRYGNTRFYPSQIATTMNSLVVTFEPMK